MANTLNTINATNNNTQPRQKMNSFITDEFVVLPNAIIPKNRIKCIKKKNFVIKVITDDDEGQHDCMIINEIEFSDLKESLNKIRTLGQENEDLLKENEMLRLHISLSPGGTEYLSAQQHFNKETKKTQ